jgi:antitoxin component YwqK of YwqJK toxin-antitoxin module
MSVELKCVQEFWGNGNPKSEGFYLNGERHNSSGPAFLRWYANGQLEHEAYWLNGNRHNAAGPAFRRWWDNGQLYYESYLLNGTYHNAAGPAFRRWLANGQLACEEYWLDDERLPKAEWEARVKPAPCDGKVVEIEGRKYKLVAVR